MKKQIVTVFFLMTALGLARATLALDPYAPPSFRNVGMITVRTPNLDDQITITHLETGASQSLKPSEMKIVPIGIYKVSAKIQEYSQEQEVAVEPTERCDVTITGYGNIKVNSPAPASIGVYLEGTQTLVAEFPDTQIKTLPTGHYDVRVKLGKNETTHHNIWVITNITRELDVTMKTLPPKEPE
jgi:hypothetical protein